ncbi:SDR family NAD(P)-dependent oxidoreductase [Candidatus Uhrbacteria bacterium]|nr:SDR family NAD(P)-dependent oxidoreductase [Candidatus Uhrbacteria bacterium]
MKTVLITGVGKGIGRALAETCLAKEHFVIGTYQSTLPKIQHERFVAVRLDLSDPDSIVACEKSVREIGYPIDIHINNAGILLDGDETRVDPKKLRATLEVNVIGTIDFTERIIPLINTGGHIVNISSSAGSLALSQKMKSHYPHHYPAYKISKTALNMYTVTLAEELKKSSITVSSVNPGWVKTDMGGPEGEYTPAQAAERIYKLAIKPPKTGNFWFGNKKLPW